MKCPHCSVAFHPEVENGGMFSDPDRKGIGYRLGWDVCPSCLRLIGLLEYGRITVEDYGKIIWHTIESTHVIYPVGGKRFVASEVPQKYARDYEEASAVADLSPKASAALSRRLLQNILREEYGIKQRSLAAEIEEFIQRRDIPQYITEAIDAVRNIGNFAAHPIKNTNTGEVVDVEPGEAEWLLEVLEALFDFTFVQPIRLKQRKAELNHKLENLGKPGMKDLDN